MRTLNDNWAAINDKGELVKCNENDKYNFKYYQRYNESPVAFLIRYEQKTGKKLDDNNDDVFSLRINSDEWHHPTKQEEDVYNAVSTVHRMKTSFGVNTDKYIGDVKAYYAHIVNMEKELRDAKDFGLNYWQEVAKDLDYKRKNLHDKAMTSMRRIEYIRTGNGMVTSFYEPILDENVNRHAVTDFIMDYFKYSNSITREICEKELEEASQFSQEEALEVQENIQSVELS